MTCQVMVKLLYR